VIGNIRKCKFNLFLFPCDEGALLQTVIDFPAESVDIEQDVLGSVVLALVLLKLALHELVEAHRYNHFQHTHQIFLHLLPNYCEQLRLQNVITIDALLGHFYDEVEGDADYFIPRVHPLCKFTFVVVLGDSLTADDYVRLCGSALGGSIASKQIFMVVDLFEN
jgi:hypothetical protein